MASNVKDKQIMPTSSLGPKTSPAVLIPSASIRYELSAINRIRDKLLHPEFASSPSSGDTISLRASSSVVRRQRRLIIGSLGGHKIKGNQNLHW